METFISRIMTGDLVLLFQLCNVIFIILVGIAVLFVFALLRQKSQYKYTYTTEFINQHSVNVLYSKNWEAEELPVILVIPGNPGHAGFYYEYLNMVVEQSGGKYRSCAVSHVGHSPCSEKIFNVRDQVESKLQFITTKLKPDTKIVLVGHSFGAYVSLKLLEKGIKIEKAILLFPMFDSMADMPGATKLKKVINLQPFIYGISWLTDILPKHLKEKMIQFYSSKLSRNMQDYIIQTITELIVPDSLKNVVGLAQSELAVIKEPDWKLIKKHKEKLVFYYGMNDLWAPLECLWKLRKNVPGVNFHIAEDYIRHAFMFSSCQKVAQKTVEFLTTDSKYDINMLIPTYAEVAAAGKDDKEYDFCD